MIKEVYVSTSFSLKLLMQKANTLRVVPCIVLTQQVSVRVIDTFLLLVFNFFSFFECNPVHVVSNFLYLASSHACHGGPCAQPVADLEQDLIRGKTMKRCLNFYNSEISEI